MQMRKILIPLAAGFLAVAAHGQSLKFISVGNGIYCRFDPNCQVTPTVQSDSFTPTNAPGVTCVLESRSFPGTTMASTGTYGYEYQVILNNNGLTATNVVTVDSLTLKFGTPDVFAFGGRANNQVWVINPAGPPGFAPASADVTDGKVTLNFSPPLTLSTVTDQSTNTFYLGMMSGSAPQITTAILAGTAQDPIYGPVAFKAPVRAQTP